MHLSEAHRHYLLRAARNAIRTALRIPLLPVPEGDVIPEELRENRATFVTLTLRGELRGCIGTLDAHRPLIADVEDNARMAAFEDSRFAPLQPDEEPGIHIHISILSPPEPMSVTGREDLLRQLQPGVDGLILRDGIHRATFLPSVWEQLPHPEDFLFHLFRKAGLRSSAWSPTLTCHRYTTESFGEPGPQN